MQSNIVYFTVNFYFYDLEIVVSYLPTCGISILNKDN